MSHRPGRRRSLAAETNSSAPPSLDAVAPRSGEADTLSSQPSSMSASQQWLSRLSPASAASPTPFPTPASTISFSTLQSLPSPSLLRATTMRSASPVAAAAPAKPAPRRSKRNRITKPQQQGSDDDQVAERAAMAQEEQPSRNKRVKQRPGVMPSLLSPNAPGDEESSSWLSSDDALIRACEAAFPAKFGSLKVTVPTRVSAAHVEPPVTSPVWRSLNIAEGYVPTWQPKDAIRELIQNTYDGAKSIALQRKMHRVECLPMHHLIAHATGQRDARLWVFFAFPRADSSTPTADAMLLAVVRFEDLASQPLVSSSAAAAAASSSSASSSASPSSALASGSARPTWRLTLDNKAVVLSHDIFTLGHSDKRAKEVSALNPLSPYFGTQIQGPVGHFGDGLKVGLTCLLRNHARVSYVSNSEEWRVVLVSTEENRARLSHGLTRRHANNGSGAFSSLSSPSLSSSVSSTLPRSQLPPPSDERIVGIEIDAYPSRATDSSKGHSSHAQTPQDPSQHLRVVVEGLRLGDLVPSNFLFLEADSDMALDRAAAAVSRAANSDHGAARCLDVLLTDAGGRTSSLDGLQLLTASSQVGRVYHRGILITQMASFLPFGLNILSPASLDRDRRALPTTHNSAMLVIEELFRLTHRVPSLVINGDGDGSDEEGGMMDGATLYTAIELRDKPLAAAATEATQVDPRVVGFLYNWLDRHANARGESKESAGLLAIAQRFQNGLAHCCCMLPRSHFYSLGKALFRHGQRMGGAAPTSLAGAGATTGVAAGATARVESELGVPADRPMIDRDDAPGAMMLSDMGIDLSSCVTVSQSLAYLFTFLRLSTDLVAKACAIENALFCSSRLVADTQDVSSEMSDEHEGAKAARQRNVRLILGMAANIAASVARSVGKDIDLVVHDVSGAAHVSNAATLLVKFGSPPLSPPSALPVSVLSSMFDSNRLHAALLTRPVSRYSQGCISLASSASSSSASSPPLCACQFAHILERVRSHLNVDLVTGLARGFLHQNRDRLAEMTTDRKSAAELHAEASAKVDAAAAALRARSLQQHHSTAVQGHDGCKEKDREEQKEVVTATPNGAGSSLRRVALPPKVAVQQQPIPHSSLSSSLPSSSSVIATPIGGAHSMLFSSSLVAACPADAPPVVVHLPPASDVQCFPSIGRHLMQQCFPAVDWRAFAVGETLPLQLLAQLRRSTASPPPSSHFGAAPTGPTDGSGMEFVLFQRVDALRALQEADEGGDTLTAPLVVPALNCVVLSGRVLCQAPRPLNDAALHSSDGVLLAHQVLFHNDAAGTGTLRVRVTGVRNLLAAHPQAVVEYRVCAPLAYFSAWNPTQLGIAPARVLRTADPNALVPFSAVLEAIVSALAERIHVHPNHLTLDHLARWCAGFKVFESASALTQAQERAEADLQWSLSSGGRQPPELSPAQRTFAVAALAQIGACSERSITFMVLASYLFDHRVMYSVSATHAFITLHNRDGQWMWLELGGGGGVKFQPVDGKDAAAMMVQPDSGEPHWTQVVEAPTCSPLLPGAGIGAGAGAGTGLGATACAALPVRGPPPPPSLSPPLLLPVANGGTSSSEAAASIHTFVVGHLRTCAECRNNCFAAGPSPSSSSSSPSSSFSRLAHQSTQNR